MDWKTKATFLSPSTVEHQVGDSKLRFSPVSVGMAFKLRAVAQPLAAAIATLFASEPTSGSIRRSIANSKGEYDSEIISESPSAEVLKLKAEQKQKAVNDLITALTAQDSLHILGEIIMDSLQEIFPRGNSGNPPVAEFINSVPLPRLLDLLIGVAKANKGVLGPLERQFDAMTERVRAAVQQRIEAQVAPASAKSSENGGAQNSTAG